MIATILNLGELRPAPGGWHNPTAEDVLDDLHQDLCAAVIAGVEEDVPDWARRGCRIERIQPVACGLYGMRSVAHDTG